MESVEFGEGGRIEGENDVPNTITQLYKRAINVLLFKHDLTYKNKKIPKDYIIAKLPEELRRDLDKLKKTARDGIMKDQLVFGDDIVNELSNSAVLNKLEDKRQNMFCFLHLTIQEFLAALHVVDEIENVKSFLAFLADHIDDPKWHLVIQFVCGLIGDKMKELKLQDRNTSTGYTYIIHLSEVQKKTGAQLVYNGIVGRKLGRHLLYFSLIPTPQCH